MKILLVDDHEMVRLGLKSYFDLQDDVEVVGEAANGAQGIDLALKLRPDVIVMDIVMPEMNGIDATLAILKEWPEAKILIVTSLTRHVLVSIRPKHDCSQTVQGLPSGVSSLRVSTPGHHKHKCTVSNYWYPCMLSPASDYVHDHSPPGTTPAYHSAVAFGHLPQVQ